MQMSRIPDFRSFCESEFHLSHRASYVSDGRGTGVEIPASTVYQAVILMGALGLGSLLQCDQILRTPIGKKWFGQKKPAVSDSTMTRSLESSHLPMLRSILHDAYVLGCSQGASKRLLRSGSLRIGIVDGSVFRRFQASCFEVVGSVSLMVGLEQIPKRGKELPSSYRLLRRLKDRFGVGFVDIILGDGLYLNAPTFNLCLNEVKSHILVKTDDASRDIIKDAMGLFGHSEVFGEGIAQASGVDTERMCSYQIMMCGGFTMEGVEAELSVAWIQEEYIWTGEREEFWAVTSADLTPEEARELSHWRWDVENNGFKALNQTVHTKHIYSHDATASEAILLILFTVFNLLQFFLFLYAARLCDYPGMKQTRKFAVMIVRCIMIALAFLEFG